MARVTGFEPATTDQLPVDDSGNPVSVGVWGNSSTGVGVFGTSDALGNQTNIPILQNAGVVGHGLEDPGIWGESSQANGIIGRSLNSSGVLGVSFGSASNVAGVFGTSVAGANGVVGFVGDASGVVGNSVRGPGVSGISGTGNGVEGESFGDDGNPPAAGVFGRSDTFGVRGVSSTGNGVQGESETGAGVKGISTQEAGVRGLSTSFNGVQGLTLGAASGVSGFQFSDQDGSGVFGESIVGTGVEGFSFRGIGVRGQGGTLAGLFEGNVSITGSLSKGGGGFLIDHPLDPENRYLQHSFVKSPDMLNVYNGNVTTDRHGEASVRLPDYFEALNHDFRYQLTAIGQFAQAIVDKELMDNQFTIKTDRPHVKVSWQVTGVRRDNWAAANRIGVEPEKAPGHRGRYLHPEVWGKPEEARIHSSTQPAAQLRRASRLAPAQLRRRAMDHVRALQRGDNVTPDELRHLVEEAQRVMETHRRDQPPRRDRSRLAEQWQQVQEMLRRVKS